MNGCAVAELNDDMVTLKEVPKGMIGEGIAEESGRAHVWTPVTRR